MWNWIYRTIYLYLTSILRLRRIKVCGILNLHLSVYAWEWTWDRGNVFCALIHVLPFDSCYLFNIKFLFIWIPLTDDIVSTQAIATTAVSHKRKLLTATDGRRHLYCMRSGSMKSLNHNNNDRNGGLGSSRSTSTSSSMTVINVPQQQRFKLYQQRHQSQQQQQQQQHLQMYMQQDIERSKSTSTPSLRLHDTALRR